MKRCPILWTEERQRLLSRPAGYQPACLPVEGGTAINISIATLLFFLPSFLHSFLPSLGFMRRRYRDESMCVEKQTPAPRPTTTCLPASLPDCRPRPSPLRKGTRAIAYFVISLSSTYWLFDLFLNASYLKKFLHLHFCTKILH